MDVRWRIKQETRISFYFICKSSQGKLSEKDKINTKIEIRKLSCEFFCSESRHMQLEEEILLATNTRHETLQSKQVLSWRNLESLKGNQGFSHHVMSYAAFSQKLNTQ